MTQTGVSDHGHRHEDSHLSNGQHERRTSQPRHLSHSGSDLRSDGHSPGSSSPQRQGSVGERRRGMSLVLRTRSDYGPASANHRHKGRSEDGSEDGEGPHGMRHGWETQLTSKEQAAVLSQAFFFMYWQDKRQDTAARLKISEFVVEEWRMRDRLKTVGALLAVCLNVGVDPPDIVKTDPCARMECWIDPLADIPQGQGTSGVTTAIGKALQSQFEAMSMRTRYKLVMDPSVEDMKKFCTTLRRTSKEERILFHYNGHGVPRPTPAGEIWVFNRLFTQYIPISLYDLQTWLGAPGIFLYDCSAAGLIIKNFHAMAQKHEAEQLEARRNDPSLPFVNYTECIHLASCREKELLPSNPDLPADAFTSCLTTPIDMAVRFFILQNPLPGGPTLDEGRNIPGKISERRTPLGELNWIFTAITDTIAWNSLPKPLFKRLFRQDLMVAALFRNFLLAQRIMRTYNCHPQSYPEVPDTHNSPLWDSWDFAVEMILKQLPALIQQSRDGQELSYNHSDFFSDQLSAFEVYLTQGALEQQMPEQLPIVLQVLLSQVHRLRALVLLSKFLDLGPWAVNLALSIGIFPYVLKLLQSQAQELKSVMVFIWARILAIDQSCQSDLLKDNGFQYFVNLANPTFFLPNCPNIAEHRAMCAFIIAMFCKDFRPGQNVCLSTNPEIIEYMTFHLSDREEPLLRQYACLCLSMLWKDFPEAKWQGIRANAPYALAKLLMDPVPEVRSAMINALTNFIGIPDLTDQVAEIEGAVAESITALADDGSVIVRLEYIVFLSTFINRFKGRFVVAAWEEIVKERKGQLPKPDEDTLSARQMSHSSSDSGDHQRSVSVASAIMPDRNIYLTLWRQVLILSADPHPEVAQNASIILDSVLESLFLGPLGRTALKLVDAIVDHERQVAQILQRPLEVAKTNGRESPVPSPTESVSPNPKEGYFTASLRRTASMAASIKNLANFGNVKDKSSHADSLHGHSLRQPGSPSSRHRSHVPKEWKLPAEALDPSPSIQRAYAAARAPSVPGFVPRDLTVPPILPLASTFVQYSMSYFREPQMRPAEADEPGSLDFNERIWRRSRNDRVIATTQPLKQIAAMGRWNVPAGVLTDSSPVSKIAFHQFEPHLLVADDCDTVSVWDWYASTRIGRWSNGNPQGSKICETKFVNEDDIALVLTGSSDGIVRIFRNYDSRRVELAASFRALSDLVPSTINVGLVSEWQQGQGRLLVAGDVRVIRVWSAGTELCLADIPARSGSNVTCLTSDQVEGNVFVAGFGDGAMRVYDMRNRPNESLVKVWKEHRGWVVGAHMQRGGMRELISAERGGAVRLWDIRMDKSVAVVKGKGEGGVGTLRSLSVHEHAPVFATGSSHNALRVFSTSAASADANASSTPISVIEPFTSMLSTSHNRAAPVIATAFHPHRLMLACSVLGEGSVSLFKCVDPNGRDVDGDRNGAGIVREWQ